MLRQLWFITNCNGILIGAPTAAVARFVHLAPAVDVPQEWRAQPGHPRHATSPKRE